MMKYYILFFVFTTIGLNSFSMSKNELLPPDSTASIAERAAATYLIEEGKNLFSEGRVKDAMNKFRDASKKDVTSWKAAFWIGRCHYEQYNYGYALRYSKDAILLNNNTIDKEVYEILGDCYHRLAIVDSAIMYYELGLQNLSKMRASELQIPLKLEQAKYAKQMLDQKITNKRIHLEGDVNSGYNDYSPVIFEDGKSMYFTSRRSNTVGGKQNPSDQQFFEDVYSAKWNSELNQWDSITNRLGKLNGEGFESISHVSEDGQVAYLTVNYSFETKSKLKTRSSDIAEVKWTKQNQWSAPKLLDSKTINSSFYDGNATVTADGQTMYFISERNGQNKMSDIYVSYKTGNTWGKPVALPDAINSKGRETTPFITPDGRYLFFSSNGHPNSMGGYDIFVVERSGSSWGEVKNLGSSVNSVNDDFGFKIYNSIGKAYVNGLEVVGDKASLDIYEFNTTLDELLNSLSK